MNMHILNEYFDEIFVINLNKRKDRFIEMSQKLNRIGLDFTIIEAEDGHSEENIEIYNKYLSIPLNSIESHELDNRNKKKTLLGPGAIGYLKSYRKILLFAKKEKHKRILVFDDDIILRKNFNTKAEKFIRRLKRNWKICMFGATQHIWNIPTSHEFIDEENKIDYYPKVTDGSFALGINELVFDEIIDKIEKYNIAFDSGILRDLYKKHPTECIVAYPYLVVADVETSDIGKNRDQYELSAKLKWDMENFDYPFIKDLVSVIVPTYNKEEFIEKSIQSLLNQTYFNIEILIQDDCSTDKTKEICNELAKKDNRIKYEKNLKNQGCYTTRNNALRRSIGKYIAIHDPDEISLQNRFAEQIHDILKYDILFSIGHVRRSRLQMSELFINNDIKLIKKVESYRNKPINGNYEWTDRKILGLQTSMFKRKVFVDYGLFWEERFSADAEILERVLLDKLGIMFPYKSQNVYQLLYYTDEFKFIYKRNENILCVSPIMNEDNITNKYKGKIREIFENNWRKRLKGEYFYPYPRFNETTSVSVTNNKLDTNIKLDINKTELKSTLINLKIKENNIKELEKEIEYQKQENIKIADWYRQEVEKINKWHEINYKNLPRPIVKVSRAIEKIKNKKIKK